MKKSLTEEEIEVLLNKYGDSRDRTINQLINENKKLFNELEKLKRQFNNYKKKVERKER